MRSPLKALVVPYSVSQQAMLDAVALVTALATSGPGGVTVEVMDDPDLAAMINELARRPVDAIVGLGLLAERLAAKAGDLASSIGPLVGFVASHPYATAEEIGAFVVEHHEASPPEVRRDAQLRQLQELGQAFSAGDPPQSAT